MFHRKWGPGIVERYEGGKVVVLFSEAGSKTLALGAVIANGLLNPAG